MRNGAFNRQVREKLLALRSEVAHVLDERSESDQVPDLDDQIGRSGTETNRALDHRLQEGETRLLHKINEALARLDEGSFGICEACDKSIPKERLLARPFVSLCLPCQEVREKHRELTRRDS